MWLTLRSGRVLPKDYSLYQFLNRWVNLRRKSTKNHAFARSQTRNLPITSTFTTILQLHTTIYESLSKKLSYSQNVSRFLNKHLEQNQYAVLKDLYKRSYVHKTTNAPFELKILPFVKKSNLCNLTPSAKT